MPNAVTDTHGLIWYLENDPRLGPHASLVFSACDQGQAWIYVPTVCLVEIVYLQENLGLPLISKDRRICSSIVTTIW